MPEMAQGCLVYFTDIVSYSELDANNQLKLVHGLNSQILFELHDLFRDPSPSPSVIALPSGDGAALCFMTVTKDTWHHILGLSVRLAQWAASNKIQLKTGIDEGKIWPIKDINNHHNVCGDTIVRARRLMDAAGKGHLLISANLFAEAVGSSLSKTKFQHDSKRYTMKFRGLYEVIAKHERLLLCYQGLLYRGWI